MNPLATSLLLTMRAGRAYTASNLARLHSTPVDTLESALQELAADGKVQPCYNARREAAFCLTRGALSASIDEGDEADVTQTSVATYPVTRRVDGALTGYGSSIAEHRALAMLVRR